jgi:N6-L-threonylcarbamoyladenine synthase
MVPVLEEACTTAAVGDLRDLDGIAVTQGPGLAGSLLVGITMARTLAWDTGLPLVPVNHLEGHIRAAWLLDPDEPERAAPELPLVALVVSGGHTFLVSQTDELSYRLLGQTVDDAAGEAFDKVGRLLGLPYPGGPSVMAAAATATRHDRRLPRAWMGESGDFSFSGLKTAVRRMVTDELIAVGALDHPEEPDGGRLPAEVVAEIAWAFQESVVDVLATKTLRAAAAADARTVVVGGGVAANRVLRERIAVGAQELGVPLMVPRPALCTDNGAMIGAAGYQRFLAGTRAEHDVEARPSWKLAQPGA